MGVDLGPLFVFDAPLGINGVAVHVDAVRDPLGVVEVFGARDAPVEPDVLRLDFVNVHAQEDWDFRQHTRFHGGLGILKAGKLRHARIVRIRRQGLHTHLVHLAYRSRRVTREVFANVAGQVGLNRVFEVEQFLVARILGVEVAIAVRRGQHAQLGDVVQLVVLP